MVASCRWAGRGRGVTRPRPETVRFGPGAVDAQRAGTIDWTNHGRVSVQKAIDLIGTGETHPGRGLGGARPRPAVAGRHHLLRGAAHLRRRGRPDRVPGGAAGLVHAARTHARMTRRVAGPPRSAGSPGSRCRSVSTRSSRQRVRDRRRRQGDAGRLRRVAAGPADGGLRVEAGLGAPATRCATSPGSS